MFPPRAYSPPQTPEFINARLSSNLKLDDRPRPHHGNDEKKSDPRPTIRHATHSSSKSKAPASANQLSGRKSKQHLRPAQSRTSLKTVSETDALPNQTAESAPSNHRAKVEKPLVDDSYPKVDVLQQQHLSSPTIQYPLANPPHHGHLILFRIGRSKI